MRTIKLFSYILIPFLLSSCGEDFFDSITEVDIPEHEPQLVVHANFNPTFGEKYGYSGKLNHTLGILDTTKYEAVEDAIVTLLEDNEIKMTFENYVNYGWYSSDAMTLLVGKNYTLKAESPTYGSLESTQQLPNRVPIITATYEADAAVDRYGDRGDEITIQFQDPAGEKNYYQIDIWATYPFEGPDTNFINDNFWVYASPVDPILDDLSRLYLTDVSFDGEMYTTRISIELMEAGQREIGGTKNLPAERIRIKFTSISKDEYLFQKTLSAYRDNEDNPFAEPVVIHENVEGGSGIFTMSVTDEFPIDL